MAFKSLDLQMSIPRTQDVSILQSQAAQKPIVDQNLLANQTERETEEKRTQSSQLEKSAKAQVQTSDQGKAQQEGQKGPRSKRRDANDADPNEAPAHPYKGHHLDISL
ncbi:MULTISPECIES: hypothetical protein [unclassified Paenibacillus]|uniref:hypothetical protein n=1 Tax=unclassified Paenibacillus TaxID=185978 RepID=UPI002F3E843C